MSNVKELIVGAVTIMSNEDAEKVWDMIQATFALANAEEAVPEENELLALKAYHDGDPEYAPSITQEELAKDLGLGRIVGKLEV